MSALSTLLCTFNIVLTWTYVCGTQVKLTGGSSPREGLVQIFHNGWGTICDDAFGLPDAQVICNMLGFSGAEAVLTGLGSGPGSILLDDVNCGGTETDISQCGGPNWGIHNCQHSEDVGVRCQKTEIRLTGGRGNYDGRVELFYGSSWGTICSTGFDDTDAQVVCRQLGFSASGAKAFPGGHFGTASSSSTILMDRLACNGTESEITHCRRGHSTIGSTSQCTHNQDVGVSCDHTPVRLVGGHLPSEGRLEVQHNGVWGSVCSTGFTRREAVIVCGMLGFQNVLPSVTSFRSNGQYGVAKGPVWLSDLICTRLEPDISLCNASTWDNTTCNHGDDVVLSCDSTDVRLTGGAGPWEGYVEVNMDGSWSGICESGFDQNAADVVCGMLGYTGRDAVHTLFKGDYFGHPVTTLNVKEVHCTGDERDILHCKPNLYTPSCSTHAAVGIRCQGAQVRLMGGASNSEGRVEIYHAGEWGTICDADWDDVDATVICRMLVPYPQDSLVQGRALRGSYFGHGGGQVWLSDVRCNGTESDVMSCQSDATGGINCDHGRDAGVSCNFGEEIRLIGGLVPNEGTVEVKMGSSWESICDHNWDFHDAQVVCNSIGYWSGEALAYKGAHFGQGNGSSVNISAQCNGREHSLYMCNTDEEWNRDTCSHSQDAGVRCSAGRLAKNSIRLADGATMGQGRLEVKVNGQWVSFCADQWDHNADNVVCRTLSYRNTNASFFSTPRGLSSTSGHRLMCDGNETNIGMCNGDFNVTKCDVTSEKTVGIDCTDGVIGMLSNGMTLNGTVLLTFPGNSTPTTVCAQGFDEAAANVLCSMMGYVGADVVVQPGVVSSSPVSYTAVACDGWEQHISQCSATLPSNQTHVCPTRASIQCFNCTRELTGISGYVTSPNFPGSYYANTDCLYVINAGETSTLYKIEFNKLDLAGDGDFVEVRDAHQGHQLAYFTTSQPSVPILVANGDFFIRFKTNSQHEASGFNISWSPLQLQDAFTSGCDAGGWHLTVNSTILRRIYPDTGVSQIKLAEQLCMGRIHGDLVVFTQSYTECSTKSTIVGDNVIYTNELVYPEASSPFPLITHGYRWKVKVQCDVKRTDTLATNFHPIAGVANMTSGTVHGSTHYALDLKFYKDGTFYKEITGNPVVLKTGNDVFVMAKMNSDDTHIKMRLDTCITKPDPSAGPQMTYPLIRDGCVVDPMTFIISQGNHETKFAFNAFEFPANHDSVYVTCNATFCSTSDLSGPCRQTCGSPQLVGRALSNSPIRRITFRDIDVWKIRN